MEAWKASTTIAAGNPDGHRGGGWQTLDTNAEGTELQEDGNFTALL